MDKFKNLGIGDDLLKILEEDKITIPTEIQEKTIPLVLEGKDVIAASYTGSGKTLAFGLAMVQNIERGAGIQGLVLTPTRELAMQVAETLKKFSRTKKLKVTAVYGGTSIGPQIKSLETSDIVVGTPGRMLDHIDRRTIELKEVKILVLDEADLMLDMGFMNDVEDIISECPEKRQTTLFSATMPDEVFHLSRKYLNHPVKISAEAFVDPKKLKQVYYEVYPDNLKFSLFAHLIKCEHSGLIMVFCNTRRNVDFVSKNLRVQGIEALSLHGGHTQNKRDSVMLDFHSKKAKVLVCTDVAARGLDIKGVSHIYNYDAPKDSKEYIHRIGRTARAGEEGIIINLVSSRDSENFRTILMDRDFKIDEIRMPIVERIRIVRDDDRREGGGFGNRSEGDRRGGFRSGRSFERSSERGFGPREHGDRKEFGSGSGFSGRGRFNSERKPFGSERRSDERGSADNARGFSSGRETGERTTEGGGRYQRDDRRGSSGRSDDDKKPSEVRRGKTRHTSHSRSVYRGR